MTKPSEHGAMARLMVPVARIAGMSTLFSLKSTPRSTSSVVDVCPKELLMVKTSPDFHNALPPYHVNMAL
jgi:hypothetical protein